VTLRFSSAIVAGVLLLGQSIAMPAGATTARDRPGIGSTVAQWKHAYAVDHGHGCNVKNPCFGAGLRQH
jgi:hypothetical protein